MIQDVYFDEKMSPAKFIFFQKAILIYVTFWSVFHLTFGIGSLISCLYVNLVGNGGELV